MALMKSCFSLIAICSKQFEAYQKDKKLVTNVNVMINNIDSRENRRSVNFWDDNSNILSIPVPAINGEERAKSAPPVLPTLDVCLPKQRLINKR